MGWAPAPVFVTRSQNTGQNFQFQGRISFRDFLTKPGIRHLFQLGDWLKYEPETDRNNNQLWIIKHNLTINKTFQKCAALYDSRVYLQTLLGAVAPVAVLAPEWLLSVGL